MKKILLTVLLLGAFASSYGQATVSLLAYGGGLTGSRFYPLNSEVRIKGDWCYGGGLEFDLGAAAVSLLWTSAQTRVTGRGTSGYDETFTNLTMNYYKLGFQRWLTDGSVRPYTQLTLGANQMHPTGGGTIDVKSGDQWFFATTFGLGVSADINEKVAIRVQAAANMPLEMGGAGVFCTFGGCAPNVYFNPIVLQGEFTAGLAFKLNNP